LPRTDLPPGVRWLVTDPEHREERDWYITPPEATEALLSVYRPTEAIWEPACGDGAISKVLIAHGHTVHSTDLIDRGYGQGGVDFLQCESAPFGFHTIVTNPPFKHAEEFVRRGLQLCTRVIIFQRLMFLESRRRYPLFIDLPFQKCIVHSNRVPVWRGGEPPGKGGKMTPYAWFIWDKNYIGSPQLDWVLT
jgi:hypothetical protein